MFQISVEGYSFHGLLEEGKMDIFHMLETVKYRYNVDAVGIWNGFFTSTDMDYIAKVGEELRRRDMLLPNIAVDGANVCSDDDAKREKQRQTALKYLEIAARLGAKSMRLDWGVPRETLTEAEEELIVRRYREYCDIAQRDGFLVCAENHAGAARNPRLMKKLFEEIGHPAYRVLLHVGSWYCDRDIGDEMILPYAAHTHVMQKVVEDRLREVLVLFRKAGYQGYIGVEQHGGKNEYEAVGWQIAAVRRGIADLLSEEAASNG